MDIKSVVIGFLMCLVIVLLMGFGGTNGIGRYQAFDNGYVIDTTTGAIKDVKKFNTPFQDLP